MRMYILIYLVVISTVTFVLFGIDKYKAKKSQRRISEKNLLQLVALGGGLGALLGMEVFRHKTIKGSFLWKFWSITLLWVLLLFVSVQQ